MENIYVGKTDKGYIKGDVCIGVEFVKKENARRFTESQAQMYKQSIADDMFDFFDCKYFEFEKI